MLLYHLGQRHLEAAGPYLRRMETECIDAVRREGFALEEGYTQHLCSCPAQHEHKCCVYPILGVDMICSATDWVKNPELGAAQVLRKS
jgi:hypothetical protein